VDLVDFDGAACSVRHHHGSESALREIDLVDRLLASLQLFAQRQIDPLQMRSQQREIDREVPSAADGQKKTRPEAGSPVIEGFLV